MSRLNPCRRILASAGTGKTFALTTRYLAILLGGREVDPRSILATTFTRAAAGEIRGRILRRLATAVRAATPMGRKELEGLIGAGELDPSDATPERCAAALRRLLDDLDRLQARTIDSFFFAVAGASAIDLGLPWPLEPLDEHGEALLESAAVEGVIESLDAEDPEAFLATLEALTEGNPGRAVGDLVRRATDELARLAEEAPEEAWTWTLPKPPAAIATAATVAALEAIAPAIEQDKAQGGTRTAEAMRKTAARLRSFGELDPSSIPLDGWVGWLDGGLTGAVAAKGGTYYSKPLPSEVITLLEPIVARARWEVERIALWRTTASARLAVAVRDERRRLLERRGATTFAEVTRLVGRQLGTSRGSDPLGELLARLDARVDHLLLDEFQDTSVAQWSALRPIASEIVARGDASRTFLAVGDLKQSIYGWRGAEPEILEHLGDRLAAGQGARGSVAFKPESLQDSYRSTPQVLEAVNAVLGSIGTSDPALEASPTAARWWAGVFEAHRAKRKECGLAELHLVPREPEGAAEEEDEEGSLAPSPKTRRVVELVRALRGRLPDASIGIVVRRNRTVAATLAALRASGIDATGWGGGSIRDSAAASAALEFLRLCDQPDHSIAAFHVASSPLGAAVGLDPRSSREDRLAVATRFRARLLELGAAAVLEELRAAVEPHLGEGDRRRWGRLLEAADAIDLKGWTRPIELVDAADAVRVGESAASLVTVLNVHQAKGLEFDSVICPELDVRLRPSKGVLVERDADGRILRIVRRLRGVEHVPALAAVREASDARQVRESLCLLYVALTRARDRLFMLVDAPKPKEEKRPATAAGVIREALATPGAPPSGVVWRSGDGAWLEEAMQADASEASKAGVAVAGAIPATSRATPSSTSGGASRSPEAASASGGSTSASFASKSARSAAASSSDSSSTSSRSLSTNSQRQISFVASSALRTRRGRPPSSHEDAQLARAISITGGDAAERGTAIHALFEAVGFLEDGIGSDESLERVLRRVVPRASAARRAERIAEFRAMLGRPAIAAALRRPTDGPAVLSRERAFVSVEGGAVRQGIIDRLVVVGTPGAWTRAEVIDFKTDALEGDPPDRASLAAKQDLYRAQLLAYRDEVARQFDLDSGSVAMRLLLVSAGVVVDL